ATLALALALTLTPTPAIRADWTNGPLNQPEPEPEPEPETLLSIRPLFPWRNRQINNLDRGVRGYTTKRAGRAVYVVRPFPAGKQRRVKCDEGHPRCGGCARHDVECLYPAQIATPTVPSTASRAKTRASSQSKTAASTAAAAAAAAASASAASDSPDTRAPSAFLDAGASEHIAAASRERRHWELRLLHNHLTMGHPFNAPQPPEMTQLFMIDVLNMALRDGWDVLLYGIMAHSALHMWTRATTPQERDHLIILQQTYKSMMLREQAREVVNLTLHNADALCFSSLKILAHALALVQTLPMDPWQPPIEWLRMGKGAGAVFRAAVELVGQENSDAKVMTFIKHLPVIIDRKTTIESDHSALDWLLEHPGPTYHDGSGSAGVAAVDDDYVTELDDPAVRKVYHEALGYTCSVARAIEQGESEDTVGRRLGAFAVLVPNDFTQFLIERRPRAMVVLAHFMSLWLDYEHIWIIGKAGERQIRGIRNSLPPAWSSKLDGLFGKLKGKGRAGTAGVVSEMDLGWGFEGVRRDG
ncbi:hypothetical protein PG993_013761, partial [Apiospora rasikravindrae]